MPASQAEAAQAETSTAVSPPIDLDEDPAHVNLEDMLTELGLSCW